MILGLKGLNEIGLSNLFHILNSKVFLLSATNFVLDKLTVVPLHLVCVRMPITAEVSERIVLDSYVFHLSLMPLSVPQLPWWSIFLRLFSNIF